MYDCKVAQEVGRAVGVVRAVVRGRAVVVAVMVAAAQADSSRHNHNR